MYMMRPVDSPSDWSKGHISSVVGPEASTAEGKGYINLSASEKSMSYSSREKIQNKKGHTSL